MEIINPFLLLLILVSFTTICSFSLPPKPFPSAISTLDPKQLTALQYLNIPISKDPCRVPSHLNATACDGAQPFQHLTMLHLINCSDDTEMSSTAMKSLITLQDLGFVNCPIQPVRLPSELSLNLKSFTCIDSLTKVTGVWLSRFQNLTNLKISNVEINASGPSIILSNMKNLRSVIISNTTLTGLLPKFWHSMNITSLDLSNNKLKGHLPTSITFLSNLNFLNLSSNSLSGEIPNTFGDLLSLQNVSFAYNSMSGQIPQSMADISSLLHLDLGSNQFNGSIPKFLSEMKNLKYLNLENNNFHGVMPFNFSFVKKLEVFKVGGNSNLCYNKSVFSSKLKLGIAPCDKYGLPISPPPQRASDSSSYKYNGDDDQEKSSHKSEHQEQHGPNKLILGVGIGLCSVVFLIIFIIFLSKRCK